LLEINQVVCSLTRDDLDKNA